MIGQSVVMPVNASREGHGRRAGIRQGRADAIVNACVMSAFDVSTEEIALESRGPAPVALARQVAMYLHHVELRQSLTEVASRFGRDRTTVALACRTVEDRRDDPAFDGFIGALEAAIRSARALLPGARSGA